METLFFVMFLKIPVRVKNDAVGDIKKGRATGSPLLGLMFLYVLGSNPRGRLPPFRLKKTLLFVRH
jgi:hypothetical protein